MRNTAKTPSRNAVPMLKHKRDADVLISNKKPLAIAGRRTEVLSAFYVIRECAPDEENILFLLHAPKKLIRPAHDRNRIKRLMREAIRHCEALNAATAALQSVDKQVLILIRATRPPSKDCNMRHITSDINVISKQLTDRLIVR